jgi:hypothetical protein
MKGKIQAYLGEVVRSTVEETLNAMFDAEADRLRRAERDFGNVAFSSKVTSESAIFRVGWIL